jgi:hypothetical protein
MENEQLKVKAIAAWEKLHDKSTNIPKSEVFEYFLKAFELGYNLANQEITDEIYNGITKALNNGL